MVRDSVSILAIGSEILDGRVQDSNSQWIAKELANIGVSLRAVLVCDDDLDQIVSALTYLTAQSTYIIVSGGLGPTTDDLTREAIAQYAHKPLCERSESITRLQSLYAKRQRVLDPSNYKQTVFPEGSVIINNDVGTAEGFLLTSGTNTIFSVPGVPKELKPMFLKDILPKIKECIHSPLIHRRSFRIFGLPESNVGSQISSLNLPSDLSISYRASFPEIHVAIKGIDSAMINTAIASAKSAIGLEYIFSEDVERSLPEAVGKLLLESSTTVSVAESCTGGMLGSYLTLLPGSSKFFLGGYLTYSNTRKIQDIDVSSVSLEKYGAVSEQVAIEMAQGARKRTDSDLAISITGIAGPDGGSDEKPVGTFFIGVSSAEESIAFKNFFLSDRTAIRTYATYRALDTIRRRLFI